MSRRNRRLRPRYTVRTLMLLVTLAAALFGYESYVLWKEGQAAREIEKLYGSVEYTSLGPDWLTRLAGEGYRRRVRAARIHSATIDMVIPFLEQFRGLEEVRIVSGMRGSRRRNRAKLRTKLPGVKRTTESPLMHRWTNSDGLEEVTRILRNSKNSPSDVMTRYLFSAAFYVVLSKSGEFLVVAQPFYGPIRGGEAAMICLIKNHVVVDWKHCDARFADITPSMWPELQMVDFNGDGALDAGFHAAFVAVDREDVRPHIVNESGYRALPYDPRLWLAAYEITPTGFKSLFDEKDELAADE